MNSYSHYRYPIKNSPQEYCWQSIWWSKTRVLTLLYSLLFLLFICFVLTPFGKMNEQQINGKSLLPSEQLEMQVKQVEELIQEPVSENAIHYFEIINKFNEVKNQCELFLEQSKGAPVPYSYVACRNLITQSFHDIGELQVSYHRVFANEKMFEARDLYTSQHPDWEERALRSIHTSVFLPEEAIRAFLNGMLLSILFLLVRLFQKDFNIYLELCNPRFWLAVICWPVAIFIYPGDPIRQIKDLARMFSCLITVTISCFTGGIANAAGKILSKAKEDEESTWVLSGFAQGVLDGNSNNGFREGTNRLIVKGKFLEGWSARLELSLSRFDLDKERYVRQAYLKYSDDELGNFQIGRFFPVGGWTTPTPDSLATVLYPKADPSRGEANGIQYSKNFGDITGYFAFTGLSGKSLVTDESFSGHEFDGRIEWKFNQEILLAITGQSRPDVTWISAELQYLSPDKDISVRSVVYGGNYTQKQSFVSGYVLGSYECNSFLSSHIMIYHGLDEQNRGTIGTTLKPLGNKYFSLTADAIYNLDKGEIEPNFRIQFSF